jgi:hypothetical protein
MVVVVGAALVVVTGAMLLVVVADAASVAGFSASDPQPPSNRTPQTPPMAS